MQYHQKNILEQKIFKQVKNQINNWGLYKSRRSILNTENIERSIYSSQFDRRSKIRCLLSPDAMSEAISHFNIDDSDYEDNNAKASKAKMNRT